MCDAAPLGEATAPALLRWTLGNLDEAFRSCIAHLESRVEESEERGNADFAVEGRGGANARFRSCDGPIERSDEPDLPHGLGRA